jgi:hypothetical protein
LCRIASQVNLISRCPPPDGPVRIRTRIVTPAAARPRAGRWHASC